MPTGARTYDQRRQKTYTRRASDSNRPNANRRGYTYQWSRTSKAWLMAHPLCVECSKRGELRPATCVDHIVPHRGDRELFWDVSNWQGLCTTCHGAKTAGGR